MKARNAHNLHHSLGSLTTQDLNLIITQDQIKDNPITIQDVDLATHTFEPDIGSMRVSLQERNQYQQLTV